MKVSLTPDKSLYQFILAHKSDNSLSFSSLSPVSLLSLLISQIDLLIEEKIRATLWVKLPPGKIWRSEIQRYYSWLGDSGNIFNYYAANKDSDSGLNSGSNSDLNSDSDSSLARLETKTASPNEDRTYFTNIELKPENKLRREYFVIVQSPQWCNFIFSCRERINRQKKIAHTAKVNRKFVLLTVTSFDRVIVQSALEAVQKQVLKSDPTSIFVDFTSPPIPDPRLITKLSTKQSQRQDEIYRYRSSSHIVKVQQQNQKLENDLQLKHDYLKNVCQELRTPLTHMKTALSLLNSPSMKNPQRQRYLQMLSSQCERQNSLIHGILDLAQIERNLEEMSLEALHLADIVPGVVSTYQPIAQEKGIMLAYTVSNKLPSVWCVRGGLKQILIHLLANSIKFTPGDGQVWVRGRTQGKYVELEVRDTGVGIADSDIPQIFERFYRVRSGATEESAGAGLGLTIVQQLLCRSGGSISVKSKLAEGSTFTVRLPSVIESERNLKLAKPTAR